jgi:hypothetical protein
MGRAVIELIVCTALEPERVVGGTRGATAGWRSRISMSSSVCSIVKTPRTRTEQTLTTEARMLFDQFMSRD